MNATWAARASSAQACCSDHGPRASPAAPCFPTAPCAALPFPSVRRIWSGALFFSNYDRGTAWKNYYSSDSPEKIVVATAQVLGRRGDEGQIARRWRNLTSMVRDIARSQITAAFGLSRGFAPDVLCSRRRKISWPSSGAEKMHRRSNTSDGRAFVSRDKSEPPGIQHALMSRQLDHCALAGLRRMTLPPAWPYAYIPKLVRENAITVTPPKGPSIATAETPGQSVSKRRQRPLPLPPGDRTESVPLLRASRCGARRYCRPIPGNADIPFEEGSIIKAELRGSLRPHYRMEGPTLERLRYCHMPRHAGCRHGFPSHPNRHRLIGIVRSERDPGLNQRINLYHLPAAYRQRDASIPLSRSDLRQR